MKKLLSGKITAATLVLAVAAALFAGIPAGASPAADDNWLADPGAESGGMGAWEASSNVLAVKKFTQSGGTVGPRSGGYFFSLGKVNDSEAHLEQTFGLTGREGNVFAAGGWIQTQARSPLGTAASNVGDYGELIVIFSDDDGNEIDSIASGPISNPVGGSGAGGYAEFSIDGAVPEDTSSVTYRLEGCRVDGDTINVFYDDLYFIVGNTAPEASPVYVATQKNTPVKITLSALDEEDDGLIYSIVSRPAHGKLSAVDGDEVTYTPATNFSGKDTFTFKAYDGFTYSNTAAVQIEVLASTRAPIAYDAEWDVSVNSARNQMRLPAKDPNGKTLTYRIISGPSHGMLDLKNTNEVRYTPDKGYKGADSFTFRVSNGSDNSNTATVSIRVRAAAAAADSVVWLPPANTPGFRLNGSRSLPVKFKLTAANGEAADYDEDIELTLCRLNESNSREAKISTWTTGDLKYNAAQGVYSFVFHAKRYNLPPGEYELVISSGKSSNLGSIKLAVGTKAKNNNGNENSNGNGKGNGNNGQPGANGNKKAK